MSLSETTPAPAAGPALPRLSPVDLSLLGALVVSALWAAWPALTEMEQIWSEDTRYSHGFLVPLFAGFLLYHRRSMLGGASLSPSMLGVPFLLIGAALKLAAGRYFIVWFDGVSILPTLVGICLVFGGKSALRWAWPAIGFLFFMIPLPYRLENAVGPPLQRVATLVSTYILQTFGLPAQADGNVINLEDIQIGVVEACNGLGMLMMFFAYATAVAMVIRRPLLDRIIIVLSAAPIALIANILRIATTGLLHAFSTKQIADHVYHDLAGWLMMPMALAMFGTELFILSKLFVEVDAPQERKKPSDGEPARPIEPSRKGSPLFIDVRSIPARGKKPDR